MVSHARYSSFKKGRFSFELPGGLKSFLLAALVVGSTVIPAYLSDKKTQSVIAMEKNMLQEKLATDLNLKTFDLKDFEWMNEQNEYFFVFTGSATKLDGMPLSFANCKYQVSEESYDDMMSYIKKHGIINLEERTGLIVSGFMEKILDVVNESNLVEASVVESTDILNTSILGQKSVVNNITKPVIVDDKYVYYDVTYMNVNDSEKTAELNIVTKRVHYQLTDEIRSNPYGVYTLGKEGSRVTLEDQYKLEISNTLQKFNTPSR